MEIREFVNILEAVKQIDDVISGIQSHNMQSGDYSEGRSIEKLRPLLKEIMSKCLSHSQEFPLY